MPEDVMTPAEARQKILSLIEQNKALDGRLAQSDLAVNDLRAAVKALGEQTAIPNREPTGEDRDLGIYRTIDTAVGGHIRRGVRVVQEEEPQGLVVKHRPFGLLDDPEPKTKWQARLQTLVEQRSWVQVCAKGNRHDGRVDSTKTDAEIVQHLKTAPPEIRRIFADIANVGAELIPDILLPDLERALILGQERRIAGLFQTVNMPAKNWLAPYASAGLRPYKKGEPASATDDSPGQYTVSNPTIAQRTITAVAMAVRCVVDDDATEDSIIAAVPLMQEFVVDALLDGQEDAIINGDTTASHQDTGLSAWNTRGRWGATGLGGSSDHRRTVLGLRAEAIDVAASAGIRDGGSAQTLAGLMTSRSDMGLHAFPAPGDLIAITSPEYLLKMSQFAEFLSVDKAGAMAFNVNGLIGRVADVPVVVSAFIDRQYNASGVYDDTTKTKTGVLLVNRRRWKIYLRKGAMVEAARDITRGITHFVGTMRWTFKTLDANAAANTNVHWTYNLTP